MNRVATIILGGGEGTRLFPLTLTRCKPAICFGGKYRLIDIPISNSINSGCHKIFIITQFLSSSLHQHIFKTYRPGTFNSGFIELLPAEQKPSTKEWFQGTADAVRQNLEYFIETPVDYFLILSGDQIYNIDFRAMLRFAKGTDSDLVIASMKVNEQNAKRMGLLKIDKNHLVKEFCEKPQEQSLLEHMQITSSEDPSKPYLGSMGIYLFKREALIDLLNDDLREDFGKHLIPTKVAHGSVSAYIYDGYWEDIGTIGAFYQANMALTKPKPEFNCHDETNPIFSYHTNLPGPKISSTQVSNSIICDGSLVDADEIHNSILGPRTIVKKGTNIRNSYLIGNDFYAPPVAATKHFAEAFQIGENCIIRNAIIDKHVYLGNGVQLVNKKKLANYNSDDVYIRDGIIIVTRGASLPDGFIL